MILHRKAIDALESSRTANHSGRRLPKARVERLAGGLISIALLASITFSPGRAYAAENDAVSVWNERAIIALVNGPAGSPPGVQFPPPVAVIHLAIVQGAVYSAVNAIKGGHDPYLQGLKAPTSASKGAAAATAAHHVLIGLVDQAPLTATLTPAVKAAIKDRLDAEYASSLAEIPAGNARDKGIEVGARAAALMLANRQNDGRFGAGGFPVPAMPGPGQWRPIGPGFVNDPNAWVRSVRPFTLPRPEHFHTSGPPALTSAQYTAEFIEVKALGRATGSTRTAAQTSLAQWSGAHPLPMTYAAMRQVAASKGLTITEQARFHAMTSMTGADSIINCWAEKAHWSFWRPTTAIQLADTDGNAGTEPDAAWTSLLPAPPYPDEPSGANCIFSGLFNSAKAFFGSDAAEFDIISTGVGPGTGSTRHYSRFTDVIPDVIEARIYGGLHFRYADVNGAGLGRRVAEFVDANFFNCGPPGQCKQEERE